MFRPASAEPPLLPTVGKHDWLLLLRLPLVEGQADPHPLSCQTESEVKSFVQKSAKVMRNIHNIHTSSSPPCDKVVWKEIVRIEGLPAHQRLFVSADLQTQIAT